MKLILPSRDCNSVLLAGGIASSIAFMLFWPTSIPHSWTMKPKNCLADSPKAHLLGFILKPCFLAHSRVSRRSAKWSLYPLDFTTTSSI
jgi:hypothetical protein